MYVSLADDEAFEAFVRMNATTLVRLAGALTGDPHVSEEVVQAALERVFVRWRRLDDPLAYTRRVVVNLCRDRDRGRGAAGHERPGLPSAASVGRAMLTAFDAASGDILYSTEVDTHDGAPVDTYQEWNWPAQPVPGQQARWHETFASKPSAAAGSLREVENFWVSYVSPPVAPTVPAQAEQTVPALVTMVCYAGTGGCGMNNTETPAGTWSEFRTRLSALGVSSGIGAGGMFSPATLAHGIAQGQWRVERRTRLGGQQAIVLSETSKGPIAGKVLLWVDARTYLPLKYANDIGGGDLSSGIFAYLPPTAANLASFRPAIPAATRDPIT
jgi:DNA-directed RNA polymerase specialized sigma24 family protein